MLHFCILSAYQLQQLAKKKKKKKRGKCVKRFAKQKKAVHLYIEHLCMYF